MKKRLLFGFVSLSLIVGTVLSSLTPVFAIAPMPKGAILGRVYVNDRELRRLIWEANRRPAPQIYLFVEE
jgi:hypothetical protein